MIKRKRGLIWWVIGDTGCLRYGISSLGGVYSFDMH